MQVMLTLYPKQYCNSFSNPTINEHSSLFNKLPGERESVRNKTNFGVFQFISLKGLNDFQEKLKPRYG